MNRVRRSLQRLLPIWGAVVSLAACSLAPDPTMGLELSGYNHTEEGISWFSVQTQYGPQSGSGFLDAGAGGGGYTCCVSLPGEWTPGLRVIVTKATVVNGVDRKIVREVPIPKYDRKNASTLYVHFLHDGSIKAFVTLVMLGHPDYPLQGKEAELKPGVPIKIWPSRSQ